MKPTSNIAYFDSGKIPPKTLKFLNSHPIEVSKKGFTFIFREVEKISNGAYLSTDKRVENLKIVVR